MHAHGGITRSAYDLCIHDTRVCTGNSHAQNWLCAQHVCKPVLAYTKKHAPKFSILKALLLYKTN